MKYYINTKYYEFEKPNKILGITLSSTKTIELVSIGIVSEDNREYYAVNKESTLLSSKDIPTKLKQNILPNLFLGLDTSYKCLSNIKSDLTAFFHNDWEPVFYSHYADYDWVMFSSIFGGTYKLPHYYPKSCISVRQKLDSKIKNFHLTKECVEINSLDKYKKASFEQKLKWVESLSYYPKIKKRYNALSEALFTRDLDLFVKKHWKK